jgi:hypothetical protein
MALRFRAFSNSGWHLFWPDLIEQCSSAESLELATTSSQWEE